MSLHLYWEIKYFRMARNTSIYKLILIIPRNQISIADLYIPTSYLNITYVETKDMQYIFVITITAAEKFTLGRKWKRIFFFLNICEIAH